MDTYHMCQLEYLSPMPLVPHLSDDFMIAYFKGWYLPLVPTKDIHDVEKCAVFYK